MSQSFDEDLSYIVAVLSQFSDVDQALIFGSRALGTHRPGSDVDLVLKGSSLDAIVTRVGGILNDESPLPYYFDVLDYDAITNAELKAHIDRVGRVVYTRKVL
jgi:predicted nucleotidyltransferase